MGIVQESTRASDTPFSHAPSESVTLPWLNSTIGLHSLATGLRRMLQSAPMGGDIGNAQVGPCGKCVRQAHNEFGIKAQKLISYWRRPQLPSTLG
jgi:hypothetical protein